ncbi:hypothetical protein COCCADRAFT_90009 [Bipolaris zeicola 26-R-13]|uniref:Enoyl reductase (ER) domain-containing protein n=1 Tax=Cochliobolus carbonum (strain 26-R-13) TaxID=930089 RepID=W6Y840_COCC2|nr:uncharacterized protein COCCADRAFT_90009 [Bipolaris zeicola 26-R-13]EUC35787.1 hypothetical protein COCCADRAFT_90009 [Bipolaris zeicola 26-R-13]
MSGQETRQWVLANYPEGEPVIEGENATFKLQTTTLPPPGPEEVLLKALYFSNDPAQRAWINTKIEPERLYVPPVQKGEAMRSGAICEVVTSNSDSLKPGQLVIDFSLSWSEYLVVPAKAVRPIQTDPSGAIRPTHFMGALGGTGLTAYYGLIDIARATATDTVVVSGAAGATGSLVVQIAKHIVGCKRVIGIAGGAQKCKWVESLGADACVDYRSPSFKQDLRAATEGYVDVYFDNVGGDILSLMLTRMKKFGRVAACGAVSTYNTVDDSGVKNWAEIVSNRIEVRGFIVLDAVEQGKTGAMIGELVKAAKEGKIQLGPETETVVPTKFEDVPKTWMMLFNGGNKGKLVTQLMG